MQHARFRAMGTDGVAVALAKGRAARLVRFTGATDLFSTTTATSRPSTGSRAYRT
jgi:hypothetical protein